MTASAPLRVGVFGATGRMGTTACTAIAADPELELVAAVARSRAGGTVAGIAVAGDRAAMLEADVDVAVDLTVLDAARTNVAWCAEQDPAAGQPHIFRADHPTTGGYPVVAVVAAADVDRCAQARPGTAVRFRLT